jgi:hypothetical protein
MRPCVCVRARACVCVMAVVGGDQDEHVPVYTHVCVSRWECVLLICVHLDHTLRCPCAERMRLVKRNPTARWINPKTLVCGYHVGSIAMRPVA